MTTRKLTGRARFVAGMSAAVLASSVLAACGGSGSDSGGGSGESYTVGFTGPLSGAFAPLGKNILDGITLAIDAKNKEGGIEGRKIVIAAQDDKADAAQAVTAARSLIAKKALVVTGGIPSNIVEAALPTYARAGVSFVSQGAPPSVIDPAQRTMFMVEQTSASNAQPMAEFAEALLGRSDFTSTMGPVDTPSGVAWGDNMKELAKKKGFTIAESTPISVGASDMSSPAQRLVKGAPDVIFAQASDSALVPLVQKIRQLGYDGPIVNFSFGSAANTIAKLADQKLYVFRTSAQYDAASTDPGTKKFVSLVDAAGKQEAAKSATQYAQGYEIGLVVIGALEKCGKSCTVDKVTDAFNDLSVDTGGFTPKPLAFTADDHQAAKYGTFYVWDGAKPAPALDGKAFVGSVYTLDAK